MKKIKAISIRIREQYFDAIVSGEKIVEYRKWSPYWLKRLTYKGERIAVFVCGKRVHRREILRVERIPTPSHFSEQGKLDVPTASCFAIHLGPEVHMLKKGVQR